MKLGRSGNHISRYGLLVLTAAGLCFAAYSGRSQVLPAIAAVSLAPGKGSAANAETAAGVIAPSSDCPNGRIVVSAGNQELLVRPLEGNREPKEIGLPPSVGTAAANGDDSQLVRLRNGDLLLVWAGKNRNAISPRPHWWDRWNISPSNNSGQRDGLRTSYLIWRTNCGSEGTWTAPALLDSGLVAALDGKGTLRPGHCARLAPGDGGFDRPFVLVDRSVPKSADEDRVYLSTRCTNNNSDGDDFMDVFVSEDSGRHWADSTLQVPGWSELTMTVTPSGRLVLAHCIGSTPYLYISDDHGKSLVSMGTPGNHAINVSFPGAPCQWLSNNQAGVFQPRVGFYSLASIGDDQVLFAYPSVEPLPTQPRKSRQVLEIVLVILPPKSTDLDPIVFPVKTLRAVKGPGSILQASFIEAPAGANATGPHLLYWVETDGQPSSSGVRMQARYRVVNNGDDLLSNPELLSDPDGWDVTSANTWRGDYMQGGSFLDHGRPTFIAAWPESPMMMGRVVGFAPATKPAPMIDRRQPGARTVKAVPVPKNAPAAPRQ